MISFIKALVYMLIHPYETVRFTVVRRYVDAQKHFIGELYDGDGREAKMIGMSCDNLPLEVKEFTPYSIRWGKSFLEPLKPNTILAGAAEPADNQKVYDYVALRRFFPVRIIVLNRFVEHILESDYVRHD